MSKITKIILTTIILCGNISQDVEKKKKKFHQIITFNKNYISHKPISQKGELDYLRTFIVIIIPYISQMIVI